MNAKSQNQGKHAPLQSGAEDSASVILSTEMSYGAKGGIEALTPNDFPTPRLVKIAALVRETKGTYYGEVVAAVIASDLPEEEKLILRQAITEISETPPAPTATQIKPHLDKLRRFNEVKRKQFLDWRIRDGIDRDEDVEPLFAERATLGTDAPDDGLEAQLQIRAFDFANHPPMPHPIFKIAGSVLCTEGNLTNIQAPPKAGKTAVMESMIAAVLNGSRQGPDTLGFSAENPKGHALIHLDTEQSQYDHDALIRRAMRRAKVDSPPPWLSSYALVDLTVNDRRKAVSMLMDQAQRDHGGVFAVMIDGIGDLCFDPNDSAEAFDLVNHLHSLAVTHCTTVCTVLHENPGSESGKTRGHLGSQLERKAETNLRLAKDRDGVTVIWAEKARHLYLPRDHGACFAWNDQAQMHTSCGSATEIKSAATREKMLGEADAALGGESKNYTALVDSIQDALGLAERSAKGRIKSWLAEGIIRKDTSGNIHLIDP